MVTVWISGGSEEYIVAQFRAKKMIEEPNWDQFIQGVLGKQKSRSQYLAYQMDRKNGGAALSEKIRKEILEHKVPGAEPWLRLMNKYSWILTGNDLYQLKDYVTTYTSGEQYYTYQKQDQSPPKSRAFKDYCLFTK